MEMLGGGKRIKNRCRKVDIMCDAAYDILTSDGSKTTGNFYIDEEVVTKAGVTDLKQYAVNPGKNNLQEGEYWLQEPCTFWYFFI